VSRLVAILAMRCPRCCQGSVYRGVLRTRDRCPVCDLRFEREPGYFVGAMYASYALGIVLTAPIWLTLLLTGQDYALILAASIIPLFILMPVFFHYSRVIWLHWDYHFNPRTFLD
jgi:uncharacterized protein (DUF983 family)